MTTHICLIRHGETDWNAVRRIQGQTDIPLNDTGQAQAQALAIRAEKFKVNAIYSSDLSRAYETARLVAAQCGLEVMVLPKLRERNYGIFQGISAEEGAINFPVAYKKYKSRDLEYDFEIGEDMLSFSQRVEDVIEQLVKNHDRQIIFAISHAGVLDVVYRKASGRPLHTQRDFVIPYCALNWFRFEINCEGKVDWHLDSWNDQRHVGKFEQDDAE